MQNGLGQFLLEFENRLYVYNDPAILKIALFQNARDGILPDRLFKLVPDGLSYSYVEMDAEELQPQPGVVQQLGAVA